MARRARNIDPEIARVLQRIKIAIQSLGYSMRDIEKRLKASDGYLSRVFLGAIELKVDHIIGIAKAVGMAPEEVAEGVADDTVGDAQAPGVGLDLLADGAAAEEEAVEVLVAFAEEDLVRLEVEPAEDAEAGLVEIAADRGVGGTPGIEEVEVAPLVARFGADWHCFRRC